MTADAVTDSKLPRRRVPLIDGVEKVTGRARYTADLDHADCAETEGLMIMRYAVSAEDLDRFPRLRVVRVDSAYGRYGLPAWVAKACHFVVEVVKRPLAAVGFVLLAKRWVVERTFAWLGRYRRHSRDYERQTASSEAMIQISMLHRMARRLRPGPHPERFHYRRHRRKAVA